MAYIPWGSSMILKKNNPTEWKKKIYTDPTEWVLTLDSGSPISWHFCTTCSRPALLRPVTAILAPSAANPLAMAAPRPELAPELDFYA